MPIHDLRCEGCGAIEPDAIVIHDKYDPCPACGHAQRTPSYAWGSTQRTSAEGHGFTPIIFGGTTYETAEAWQGFRQQYKQIHGEELNVTGKSHGDRIVELEESAHRAIARAQELNDRRGGSPSQVRSIEETYHRNLNTLRGRYTTRSHR